MPAGHCLLFEAIGTSIYSIALSCTGLLFFIRLRAIYIRNKLVVLSFFVLWLGLIACTLLLPIEARGGHIGDTKYCIDANVPRSAYASVLAPLIHDTLVFAAISYRLGQNSYKETLPGVLKAAISGKYLPKFTKGLLHDGQRYYL